MHDDRDSTAFAVRPLLDIDAVVDAYVEADHVRQVAERLMMRPVLRRVGECPAVAARRNRVIDLLNQWADAREASVAAMLEG